MTPVKNLHASSVSVDGQAVLIVGASGSGKSALALDLMSRGAVLIADDQTLVSADNGVLVATVPASIRGQIEARGIGILAVQSTGPCPVRLVVDLDKPEKQRLPKARHICILGLDIDLILAGDTDNPAPPILALLKGGRIK